MGLISWLFDAQLVVGDQTVLWREIIGNVFGLVCAFGGMRRKVWAWPVGIAGNLLLLTVFLGTVFGTPSAVNLLGQAGRQVMFVVVSVYGWARWRQSRESSGVGVVPEWATPRQRTLLVVALFGGTLLLIPVFRALGSYEPVWADAWIFAGSLLATYGMARGWVEFWLVWVAVDLVGVPLLVSAGFYASALMYVFYGGFTLAGFVLWARMRRREDAETRLLDPPAIGVTSSQG